MNFVIFQSLLNSKIKFHYFNFNFFFPQIIFFNFIHPKIIFYLIFINFLANLYYIFFYQKFGPKNNYLCPLIFSNSPNFNKNQITKTTVNNSKIISNFLIIKLIFQILYQNLEINNNKNSILKSNFHDYIYLFLKEMISYLRFNLTYLPKSLNDHLDQYHHFNLSS